MQEKRKANESGPEKIPLIRSIGIAGAWGYIGRKILDAALALGIQPYVLDPGPWPEDVDPSRVRRWEDETGFYQLDVDLFHLALHPEDRQSALDHLFRRAAAGSSLWVLNEKPITAPDTPQEGWRLVQQVENTSRLTMLFDFPELFDPLTFRILEFLNQFQTVNITYFFLQRSKDREDPTIPRNYKRMVPIQFQETVHCLAYVLFLLGRLKGGFEAVLSEGIWVQAEAEPYDPPNPELYPYVVDGRCTYVLRLGQVQVEGRTDFKRGAPWTKRRIIKGIGDGRPFQIEAEYQEGQKGWKVNGEPQPWDPKADTYRAILRTLSEWKETVPRGELLQGVYPNPRLAWWTFQLSGLLWRSSYENRPIDIPNLEVLQRFDSGFAAEKDRLPRYSSVLSRRTPKP